MRKISTKTKLDNGKTLIKYTDGSYELISGDESEDEKAAAMDKAAMEEMSSYEGKGEKEDDEDEDDYMRRMRWERE